MGKQAWISAGKVSAAVAAVALVLGAIFQGQAQQRNDMADVRAELRGGMADVRADLRGGFAEVDSRFAEVNGRIAEVNDRLDNIGEDLVNLRVRVARMEGHLSLSADAGTQANAIPDAG